MHRFIVPIMLLSACIARAETPTVPPISGKLGEPVQLFNGKDLSGWKWVAKPTTNPSAPTANIDDVWSVKDGVLIDKGRPQGYIRTEAAYKNYVLIVKQRHVAKG